MLRMQQELNYNRYLLEERDKMIKVKVKQTFSFSVCNYKVLYGNQEHGLVIVGDDDDDDEIKNTGTIKAPKKVLVSADVASLLEKAGEGSLGNKNKSFFHFFFQCRQAQLNFGYFITPYFLAW